MRILLALITFALTACQPPGGTGTGNPFQYQNGSASPADLVSGQVIITLCKKIEICHPELTDQTCALDLQNVTGFGPKMGLDLNPEPTVEDILNLEGNGTYKTDTGAGSHCRAQMLKLECADPQLRDAYQPSQPIPFGLSPAALDPVCRGIFQP